MSFNLFISYSSKDADTAGTICNMVESQGYSCWMAPRNIDTGTPFAKAIIDGIKSSDQLLLIYSGHSIQSEQVLREVDRAVHYGKKIMVFRIDNSPCPDSLDYYLCKSKTVDATRGKYHQYVGELTKNIGAKKGGSGKPVQKIQVAPEEKYRPKKVKKKSLVDIKSFAIGFLLVSLIFSIFLVFKKISFIEEKKIIKKPQHKVANDLTVDDYGKKTNGTIKLQNDYYKKANIELYKQDDLLQLSVHDLKRLKKQIEGQGGAFFKNTRAGLVKIELSTMAKKNLEIIDECIATK